ncbi:MAG TPA: ABC transporter substrate-binding protein, partial [Patescibacteria group bacterium]|nr:ABC transporter substrate-binding protein [Patescibacteria group bacterium]
RHAMSAGINRQLMSTLSSDGAYAPSAGAISTAWKYWDTPSVQEEPYNVTYANQLLDQAGYPRGTDGTRFTLRYQWCNTDTTEGNKCSEILRDEMAQIGIQLDMIPLDENTFMEKTYWNNWDFDLAMWSGFGTIMGWYQLYHSSNIREGNYLNCMGYNNSIVDTALDKAFSVVSKTERKAAFSTYEQEIAKDLPCFNLILNPHYSAYKVTYAGIPWGHWGFRDPANEVWWTLATGTSAPGATEPQSSGFPLLEVSIAVAAVAAISVAGFALFRRSRKK